MISYLLILILSCSFSNDVDLMTPVSWAHELSENEDGSYSIQFKASMKGDWVVYSQHTNPDGPVPTSFNFDKNDCIKLIGEVSEDSEAIKEQCPLFEIEVIKFKKESIFTQQVSKSCSGTLNASVRYMTCDGERCLAPTEVNFEIEIP